ncbi:MAG: sensor histidine kinase [Alcanivorax sp.]|nr:sensor histidine kinase [Alcanivorax sp.]
MRLLIGLGCLLLWPALASAQQTCAPTLLGAGGQLGVAEIGAGLTRVVTPVPPQNAAEVAALPETAFVPLPRSGVHVHYDETVWLRLCLQRDAESPRDWALKLLPAYIRMVALHEVRGDGTRVRVRELAQGRNDNDFSYRGPAFLLSPAVEAPSAYYLEIRSGRMAVDLLLFEHTAMSRFVALEYAGFGLYFGMMLLVVVINLFFWQRLRDPLYLRYGLALLATALFSLVTGGYLQQLVPATGPFYDRIASGLFASSVGLMAAFMLRAFRTRLYYRRLYRFGHVFIALLAIAGACGVLGVTPGIEPMRVLRILTLVGIVVFTGMAMHALFFHRSVRLYAVAFLPLVAGMLAISARSLNLFDVIPLVDHLPNIGALVHLMLLNLVLARRAGRAELHRQRAQTAALEASRAAEKALEARVRERTHDLDTANSRLREEVAEREAAQHRLQDALESERRALHGQRQFVAMLSHELRTPLAVIDTAAQGVAADAPKDQEHVHRRVDRIRRSVVRLIGVIENLLADDRIAMPSRLQVRACDMRQLIIDRFAQYADDRLRLDMPSRAIWVDADPDLIGVVVANLVDNALKYSPATQPVSVRLRQQGRDALIDVRDQGPGIPPEEAEKIFEKYYRAANEVTAKGSGLGLYLCREIVRHHNGDITLMSPAEGGGTLARVRLSVRAGVA